MRKQKKDGKNSVDDFTFSKDIRLITNLLALILIKGETQSEKIRVLDAAGYPPTEIAALLGTTANNVRVTLHKIRSKRMK